MSMRKLAFPFLIAGLAACTAIAVLPSLLHRNASTHPHMAYEQLFNRKLEEFRAGAPSGDEEEGYGEGREEGKFGEPEMFDRFDKLRRMDPATGEIPEGALMRAYRDLVAQFGDMDMSMLKTNKALDWVERGPTDIGGRTRAFMFDPNDPARKVVFAGAVGGGLWRNDDITSGVTTWTQVNPLFSNIAVTCVAYDPSNTSIMYFGTGEGWNNADSQRGAGLWKSTDGGSNWEQLPSTDLPSFQYCNRIAVGSTGDVYVATKGGLYKSTDEGASFYKVLGSGTGTGTDWATDIAIGPTGDIYVGCSSTGVYKSSHLLGANTGEAGHWTKLITGFTSGFERVQLSVAKTDSNYIYALTSKGSNTDKVYRSTNGGSTWSATGTQPNGGSEWSNGQAWYDLAIAVDPSDKNHLVVAAIDVYQSLDGGATWARITAVYGGPQPYIHPDQHGLFFREGFAQDFVITNDGGIWFTMDNGASYSERNNGYRVTQYYAMDIEQTAGSNVIIGGTQDNGSSRVNSPGLGASDGLTGADGGYCNINYLRPDTMFTTTQWSTVLRSRNGGSTFNGISNPSLGDFNTLFINPIEMDPNNPDLLYQASTALWRHNNAGSGGGGGWVQDTRDYSSQITAIGISKSVPNLTYFTAGGVVYRFPAANAGNPTSDPPAVNPSGTPSGYISCIAVDPNDGNHIVITYSSFSVPKKIMETRNADMGASATWKNLNGNFPDLPVNWAVFEPNNPEGILIGTDLGVFRCADISAPEADIYWSPERKGLGMPRVNMLRARYSDNTVHIATHGRGFFSTYSYNSAPLAGFGIEQDTVCGGAVQFIDSTTNPASSWFWDFGDGGTSTSANPVHVYASSGTYTVQMIVSNAFGADTITQSVTIEVAASAVAVAMADTTICASSVISLYASGGTSYSWVPAANLDDATSATPVLSGLNSTRLYTVTVTNAYGCVDTETVKINILGLPPVNGGLDKTITVLGDSVTLTGSGAVTYLWTPSTGLSCTTCATPKASPAVTTVYTVTGVGTNGCTGSDNVTVTVAIVGVTDPVPDQGDWLFAVRPNPVTDQSHLRFRMQRDSEVTIDLLDIQGRQVRTLWQGRKGAGEYTLALEGSSLEAGIYFVRMRTDSGVFMQKCVVQ